MGYRSRVFDCFGEKNSQKARPIFESLTEICYRLFGLRLQYLIVLIGTGALSVHCGFWHEDSTHPLFERLSRRQTGISFENTLKEEPLFNSINYLYFYDGGGVAVGDINNDGLSDIYFTGNMVANRLYVNKGDFRFEDITETAGVGGGTEGWSTGATMADVNGDGFLDI